VTGLFCHRHLQNSFCKLDTSVGVSGPHDFAARSKHVVSAPLRPPHPVPYVRDVRVTPLRAGQDVDGYGSIFRKHEAQYFFEHIWTGQITLNALDKLVFTCRGFSARISVPKADRCLDPTRRANHQSLSDASDMAAKYRELYCIDCRGGRERRAGEQNVAAA
jgi:hypothetical protein